MVAHTLFFSNRVDAEESSLGVNLLQGVDPLYQAAPNPGPDGTWTTLDDDFSGLVLQSSSPAIDRGVAQYQAPDGELIPLAPLTGYTGAAPDLGWREFGAPIIITPTATLRSTFTPPPTATPVVFSPVPTQTPLPGSATPLPASPTPVTATPLPSMTAPAPSPTGASPSPSPAASTATPVSQLTIESLSPNSAQAGSTATLTITGTGFQSGAIVSFEGGQGLPQQVLGVQVVDAATIIVTLNAQNDGSAGPQVWDVRVTNPDNSFFILENAFTVSPPP